ncbi:MAG: bifunctional 4-hydroxy-3-methylbut-2-enyl diphosphate reductase/30S ribosomal protein S1 [Clostridia bacterium]|nr:bifunctional 4-hydroxy-3-methylbut-2-enyl diphosphate reductase/30S ribosomal protein S1 [Clostridia bacterium]
MINTTIAEHSGFCYGVNRAVDMAYEHISQPGTLYCYGMLVHNEAVMEDLSSKGMVVVKDLAEIPAGGRVLIRAHGTGKAFYEKCNDVGITVVDATCPSVAKIHKIVERESLDQRTIVIIGDSAHPEVIGIAGWCSNPIHVDNMAHAEKIVSEGTLSKLNVSVVTQTTMDAKEADKIIALLKDNVEDIKVFNTVCHATRLRQEAAQKLAKESDVMLVIGSKKSSNTQKLAKICKDFCKTTYLVENVSDIQLTFDGANKYNIGIVAGASTPSWVIKEVTSYMDQFNNVNEMNFAEELEKSFVTLTNGQIVKGTVIGKDDQGVIVNVGFKSDGIVSYHEFSDDPNFTPDQVELGAEVEVKVLRVIDSEGVVVLSKKRVDQQKFSLAVEEAYNSETPIQATVTETVNGGVIAMYGPVRIFVPASQVTSRRVKDFNDFVGNTYEIKVIEYNKAKRKIIGSIKALADAKRKAAEAELWANIEVNKEYTGVVKSLTNFGAFVDIGGVDGLVHLSEMSWQRVRHASDVLKVGQEVSVFVKDFNTETKKISLGYRRAEDNPWADAENKYAIGTVVTATVMRIVPFGAFVEIVPGVDGLVHISQISSVRISKAEDVLSVGMVVEAKVIEADFEAKKINLSIKEVAPIDPVVEEVEENDVVDADNEAAETIIEI